MEYCERILGNSIVRKRVRRLLNVLVGLILLVGIADSLPAVEYTATDEIYEAAFEEQMGKEIGPLTTPIQTPDNLIRKIMPKPVSPEKASVAEFADKVALEKAEAGSGLELQGMETGKITQPGKPEFPGEPIVPAVPANPSAPQTPVVSETPVVPEMPVVPDIPVIPEAPIVPDVPIVPENPTVPPEISVPETPDIAAPDVPGEDDTPNNGDTDTGAIPVTAFLTNAEGMIYGFNPSKATIESGGILRLPSEGCTGIMNGAFVGVGEGICELYIPPNIVNIEVGALNGLTELESVEIEGENPNYVSYEGMLLDSSMTTLLLLPPGRIGTAIIPAFISRIEAYSLSELRMTSLDMRGCGVVEVSEQVFGENGANGLVIFAHRRHMETYQSIFEPLGAVVK